jgi:hypothetical protein
MHPTPQEDGFDEAEQLYIDPTRRSASTATPVSTPVRTMPSSPKSSYLPSSATRQSVRPPTSGLGLERQGSGAEPVQDPSNGSLAPRFASGNLEAISNASARASAMYRLKLIGSPNQLAGVTAGLAKQQARFVDPS